MDFGTGRTRLRTGKDADVEGANIDHNNSITNPCLTRHSLLQRAYQEAPPGALAALGQPRFVQRSGYRLSANEFAAIGMSLRVMREIADDGLGHCYWVGRDGRHLTGRLRGIYPGEHHLLMYETAVYHCKLAVESTGNGGGTVMIQLDRSDVAIYSEPPAPASALSSLLPTRSHSQSHVTAHTSKHTGMPARTPAQTHSSLAHSSPSNATQAQNRQGYGLQHWGGKGGQRFKYELAFCSFPMYRDLNPSTLQVWLQVAYHYLRVDYFVLSDGGSVDDTIMKVLSPFVDANIMEIVDIRGAYAFENKQNVLTLNDCMYRLRSAARWVLFMDFDELLYIAPPAAPPPEPEADEEGEYTPSGRKRRKKRKRHAKPKSVDVAAGSLHNLLMQHNGSAFITFGSVWWSVEYCRPPTPALSLPIQRMRFHWPHVYCVGEKDMGYSPDHCLNFYGHRKFLVDPRQVWAVQVHRPIEPLEGGVHLTPDVAYLNHFQVRTLLPCYPCHTFLELTQPPTALLPSAATLVS
ncbi:unnamed protein product [Closterium sp. Naga37s-1]|nr:unnamed protein product [Closterium sp. Naga37s-1]